MPPDLNKNSQESLGTREGYIRLIENEGVICDRYGDICRIDRNAGEGCFSLVFKAKDLLNKKKEVALKFFDPSCYGNMYRLECFHREADILKDLRGEPNILPLIQEKTKLDLYLERSGIRVLLTLWFYGSELGRFNVRHYIYSETTDPLTNILFLERCVRLFSEYIIEVFSIVT